MDAATLATATLSALSAAGILALVPLLGLLRARSAGESVRLRALLLVAGTGAVVTAIAVVTGLTGIAAPFLAPAIALGALFAVVATLGVTAASLMRQIIFVLVLTAVVFVPVVSTVLTLWWDPFATGLGYLDYGVSVPIVVAAASATLGSLTVARKAIPASPRPIRLGWSALWLVGGIWLAMLAWLVGLELAVDEVTPLILVNTLSMPPAAVATSALVERVRHRRNSIAGVVYGALGGLAAAAATAAYLIPPVALVVGLVAGLLVAFVPETGAARRIALTLLVGGGSAIVLLGLVAKDVSFIYTGQPEVLFGQVLAVVLAGGAAFGLAALLWLALRPRRESFSASRGS